MKTIKKKNNYKCVTKKTKYSGLKCVRVESIPFCCVSRVDCAAAFLYYQGFYRLGPHNSRGKQVKWSPTLHPSPHPTRHNWHRAQLTCMQSIEFYGQLGKISKNPQNLGNEQRGSNEGLLMFVTFIEFMKRS